MSNKVLDLIKQKDIVVPSLLFKNYKKLKITDTELIILIYLLNSKDNIYNPITISEDLNMSIDSVISSINTLCEKVIIKVSLVKVNALSAEAIDLDPLYNKLTNLIVEKKEVDKDLFTYIEQKFGRTLSPIEYEQVSTWNSYPEKLVMKAIDDTVAKGIVSIKYIDKILVEWNKKGYKDVLDIEKEKHEVKMVDTSLIDYDWLNDN